MIVILTYISYCAMSLYVMRGSMAWYGTQYNFPAWFANDIFSFFLGGLVPFGLYEFISWFVFRTLNMNYGRRNDIASLRYGLNYAVIGANLLLFGLKFIFVAAPMAAGILNVILDPVITLGFVALYLWYAFYQNYVDKTIYHIFVTQIMGAFAAVYALIALLNLILSLTGGAL